MSSIGKTPSSNEDSGWTKYFEEFFSNKNGNNDNDDDDNNDEEDHNNNNNCYSSIMVSDAASSSAAKRLYKNPHEKEFPLERSVIKSFNNNNKNFKTALLDDDASLQDTATSPLTTSKVLYGNQFEMPKQMEDLKVEIRKTAVKYNKEMSKKNYWVLMGDMMMAAPALN